ncbi:MAG: sugar isomerase [Clostridia bacterium]|nr:sugar isomerase [Clostridia bacterium]
MASGTLKKIKLNFLFGIIGQAVTLVIGILIPRLFIISFGSDVNGYINSINQIFVYISLLEAGVGAAASQALYTPIGKGDKQKVNGILAATNKFYTKTAVGYSLIVLALGFVYPLLIKSTLPYYLMVSNFLITGGSGVVAYFCHAKYKILLGVDGREYVTSIIATVYQVFLSVGKAVLLFVGCNVIIVQSLYLALNILQAILFTIYIKRNYKWLDLRVQPDFKSISKSKSVLIHQISALIFNNTDVLILTFFCDLKSASIYVLYKNLISLISTLINHFSNSINFRMGQIFGQRERFIKLHDVYETFHITLTFSLCTITYMFFVPFLALYTEGMDANYLLTYMPLLVVSVEILSYMRIPSQNVIIYAGHFKETQWRSLLESAINLVLSLALVYFLGIYGVLIGTVVALLYRANDIILYSNHKILNRSAFPVYRTVIVNVVWGCLAVFLFNMLPLHLDNYVSVILTAIVVCIIMVPAQLAVNFLIHKKAGSSLLEFLRNVKQLRR